MAFGVRPINSLSVDVVGNLNIITKKTMPSKIKNQDLAKEFASHDDHIKNLVFVEEYRDFFIYKNGYYSKIDYKDFENYVYDFCCRNHPELNITTSLTKDIAQQIKWKCYHKVNYIDHNHITFKDCLYDVQNHKIKPFDNNIVNTHYIPFNFSDTNIDTPVFKKFISSSLVLKEDVTKQDIDLIHLLQQMFGFLLIGNLKSAGAFFFVGEGSNGKSVMINIIRNIVGDEYCSAMNIEELTTKRFSVQHLVGKKLNVSEEEESKFIKSDKFKSLVSGGLTSAERKYGDNFDFIPRTKYVFASNKIPTFGDISKGLRRRLHIIPFNREFLPHEMDHTLLSEDGLQLGDNLKAEIPGIIGWAIEGAKKLVDNNYAFIKTKQTEEAMEEFENEVSSAVRFVRETYTLDMTGEQWMPNYSIYSDYKMWCENVGKKAMNMYNFFKDLKSVFKNLEEKTLRDAEGKTVRQKNLKLLYVNEESNLEDIKF
ncbi:MAG: hypothetical protein GY793_07530 [Proteobacteria bacterium]|nr:hypothetical protein [Pseudomonadota bacterium]